VNVESPLDMKLPLKSVDATSNTDVPAEFVKSLTCKAPNTEVLRYLLNVGAAMCIYIIYIIYLLKTDLIKKHTSNINSVILITLNINYAKCVSDIDCIQY